MDDKWEPWKEYPQIWPTKSKFFTWMRGCLRSALWMQSPIKIDFKNGACKLPPPESYTGRGRTGTYCALTGVWECKSKLEVDHIKGNIPLTDEEDILNFIKHLVPPRGSLQMVTNPAHKVKSHSERKGISFEDATIEKKAIAIINEIGDKEYLKSMGLPVGSNTKMRREQIINFLRNT